MYHEPSVQFRQRVVEGDVNAAREHLDAGVSVDVRNLGWYTALMDAAQIGNQAMLALLLDRGADIDAVDGEYGGTALYHAMTEDHADAARILIGRGADISAGRVTPIRAAVEKDRSDWLQSLIEAGLDVNDEATFSRPLLMEAVERGYRQVVTQLLGAGADPDREDVARINALRLAVRTGRDEIAQLLLASGATIDIELAARAGLVDRVRAFLEDGTNPDFLGVWDRTALQSAIAGGHLAVVRLLIEKGADVNAGEGWKPVEMADEMGLTEIAAALKSAGATEAGDSSA